MKLLLPVFLLLAPLVQADEKIPVLKPQPVHPPGIAGNILLTDSAEVPDDAYNAFVSLAKQKKARIVVLEFDLGIKEKKSPVVAELNNRLKKLEAAPVSVVHWVPKMKLAEQLKDATGVWLVGNDRDGFTSFLQSNSLPFVATLSQLVKTDGVVAADAWMGSFFTSGFYFQGRFHNGFNLIPDMVLQQHNAGKEEAEKMQAVLKANPHLVRCELSEGSAVLLRHRRWIALGDKPVTISFAPSKTYDDERKFVLKGRSRYADFTAMRRIARQRMKPVFPPAKPGQPKLEKGTLIIIGGGGTPRGLMDRFAKLAGGKEAEIIVIPISVPDPLPSKRRTIERWKRLGVKKVTVLEGRTPEAVSKPEVLEALKTATGIWFGGGRQWRFVDAYENTKAAQLMHDMLKRGGVIGGSSAGASIQGGYMARGNPLGNLDIMAPGYEQGLGFLPGVAIDQHFTQRRRNKDMTQLVNKYPQLLGIGIDESTAIVVRGHVAEVVGRHAVHFYDRNTRQANDNPDFDTVYPGGKYDLLARKILDEGDKPEEKK